MEEITGELYHKGILSWGTLIGLFIVCLPATIWPLRDVGIAPVGALLGITFIVFSLFGELPSWLSWTQHLGSWLFPGIAIGAVVLLIPFLIPSEIHESSLLAFSPNVWAAYLSIVLVSLSFNVSSLPKRVYGFVSKWPLPPYIAISLYVVVGLAGNILDGVSIISLSAIIFLHLLEKNGH